MFGGTCMGSVGIMATSVIAADCTQASRAQAGPEGIEGVMRSLGAL